MLWMSVLWCGSLVGIRFYCFLYSDICEKQPSYSKIQSLQRKKPQSNERGLGIGGAGVHHCAHPQPLFIWLSAFWCLALYRQHAAKNHRSDSVSIDRMRVNRA